MRDLEEHRALEIRLSKLDDDERHLLTVLDVLRQDEEMRRREWLAAKRDLDVLEKLREKALEDWTLSESRREQAELDEWSSLRRAA
ncbi:MAG: flagellar FliJ family protein [Fimbriimonadaceae bacterium]